MDSNEVVRVNGGTSFVRKRAGEVTNYCSNPNFGDSAVIVELMRNLAAYGSMETVQAGTAEVRRQLHVDPLFSNNRVSAVNGATVVGHSEDYNFGRGRGARITTPIGGTIDSGVSIGGSAFTGTPLTAYTFSVAIRAITAVSLSTYTSGFNSQRGTLTLAPGEVGRIWLTVTTNASGGGSGTWYVLRTDNTVGSTFDIGQPLIEQTDQRRPYFDGSSPNEKGFTTEWSGTANASASIMRAALGTFRENLVQQPRSPAAGTSWMGGPAHTQSQIDDARFPNGRAWMAEATAAGGSGRGSIGSGNQVSVTAGQTYTFSIYGAATQARAFDIQVRFFDSNNNTISDLGSTVTPTVAANTVVRVSVTGVVPSGASKCYVVITTFPGTGSANWAVGDKIYGSSPLVESGTVLGSYFDGASPNAGDFITAWSGTVNYSTSLQQAVVLASATGSQGAGRAIYSWEWESVGGSLRYFPVASGSTGSFFNPGASGQVLAGRTYTAVARLRITQPSAGYRALEVRTSSGSTIASSGSAPNVPGEYILRLTFTATANSDYIRMESRGDSGWSVWWADLTLVEGNYPDLMPFDGSTQDTPGREYFWNGTPFASISSIGYQAQPNETGGFIYNYPGNMMLGVLSGDAAKLNPTYYGIKLVEKTIAHVSFDVIGLDEDVPVGATLCIIRFSDGDVARLQNNVLIPKGGRGRVGWELDLTMAGIGITGFELTNDMIGAGNVTLFDRLLVTDSIVRP